jgi:hypothetical protein
LAEVWRLTGRKINKTLASSLVSLGSVLNPPVLTGGVKLFEPIAVFFFQAAHACLPYKFKLFDSAWRSFAALMATTNTLDSWLALQQRKRNKKRMRKVVLGVLLKQQCAQSLFRHGEFEWRQCWVRSK